MKVGMLGCGNMAGAMIKGMLANQVLKAEEIIATNSSVDSAKRTEGSLGIRVTTDNAGAAAEADIIFLGVKPDYYETLIKEIKAVITPDKIIVSLAPGKTIAWFEAQFAGPVKVVRTIPNTPCQVGAGMTGVCYNSRMAAEDIAQVERLIRSFGEMELVPEFLMEVVGAVGGSSPAFLYMIIEAMADAAVEAGMTRTSAYKIASQAVLGSGKMVLESGQHPGALKDAVCSPGGSTIAGVRVLEEEGLRGAVIDALKATIEKSRGL